MALYSRFTVQRNGRQADLGPTLIRRFIHHVVSTATQIELDFSRLPLMRKYTQVP